MLKYRLNIFLIVLLSLMGFSKMSAQNVMVNVSPKQNPLPAHAMAYMTNPGRFFNVALTSTYDVEMAVRLEAEVIGPLPHQVDDIGLSDSYLKVYAERDIPHSFLLSPHRTQHLSIAELEQHFNHYNKEQETYSGGQIREVFETGSTYGLLPEGRYALRIIVKDNNNGDTRDVIGQGLCYFDIYYKASAPRFTEPAKHFDGLDFTEEAFGYQEVDFPEDYPRFAWTEPSFNLNATNKHSHFMYHFRLITVMPNQTILEALESGTVAFEQNGLITPFCNVPINVVRAMKNSRNRNYVAQVKAVPVIDDAMHPDYALLENNGKSNVLALQFNHDAQEGKVDEDIVIPDKDEGASGLPIIATVTPKYTLMPMDLETYIEEPGSLFRVTLENTTNQNLEVALLMQFFRENWGVCAAPQKQHDDRSIALDAKETITLTDEQVNQLAGDYIYESDAIAFKAKTGFIIGKPAEDYFPYPDNKVSLRVCHFTKGQPVLRGRVAGKARADFTTDANVIKGEKIVVTLSPKRDALPITQETYFTQPERLFSVKLQNITDDILHVQPQLSFTFKGEDRYTGNSSDRKDLILTLKPKENKELTDEEVKKYFGNFNEVLRISGNGSRTLVDNLDLLELRKESNMAYLTVYNAEELAMYAETDDSRWEKSQMQEYATSFNTSEMVMMGKVDISLKNVYNPMPGLVDYYFEQPGRLFEVILQNNSDKKVRVRPHLAYHFPKEAKDYFIAKANPQDEIITLEAGESLTMTTEQLQKFCASKSVIHVAEDGVTQKEVDYADVPLTYDIFHIAQLVLMNVDSLELLSKDDPFYIERCTEATAVSEFVAAEGQMLNDIDIKLTPRLEKMPLKAQPYFDRVYSLWDMELSNKTQSDKKVKLVLTYRFGDDKFHYTTQKIDDQSLIIALKAGETHQLTPQEINDLLGSNQLLHYLMKENDVVEEYRYGIDDLNAVCSTDANHAILEVYDVEKALATAKTTPPADNKIEYLWKKEMLLGKTDVTFTGNEGVELSDIKVTLKTKYDPMPGDGKHYFQNPGLLFTAILENTSLKEQTILPSLNYIFNEDGSYYGGSLKERLDSAIVIKPNEKLELTGQALNRCCGYYEEINHYKTSLDGHYVEKVKDFANLVNLETTNQAHLTVYNTDTLRILPKEDMGQAARAVVGEGKTDFNANKDVVLTMLSVKIEPKKEAIFPAETETYFTDPGKYYDITITNSAGAETRVNLRLTYNDRYCVNKPDSTILLKPEEVKKLTPEEINDLCAQGEKDIIWEIQKDRKFKAIEDVNNIKFENGENLVTSLVWQKINVKDQKYDVDSLAVANTKFVTAFKEVKIGRYYLVMEEAKKDSVSKKTGDDCYSGKGFIKWNPLNIPLRIAVEFEALHINSNAIVTKGEVFSSKYEEFFSWDDVQKKLKGIAPEEYKEALSEQLQGSQIYEYFKYVKHGMKAIKDVTDGKTTLPARLDGEITGGPVSVQLTSMYFTPDTATMNILAEFVMPESDCVKTSEGILVFSAEKLPVGEDTWLPESGVVKLISDFTVKDQATGFDITFLAPSDQNVNPGMKEEERKHNGCFVEWANGKFQEITVDASMSIPSQDIVKYHEEITEEMMEKGIDTTPNIRLTASIRDAEDWIGQIRMDAFQFKDAPGYTFSFTGEESGLAYDHSKKMNPDGMVFPDGYEWKNSEKMVEWQGFYFQELSVTFPKFIEVNENGERLKLALKHMLGDKDGFSCTAEATNVLDVSTGKLGGWGFSIDDIHLNILKNKFDKFGFSGAFDIPLLDGNIGYDANVNSIKRGENETGNQVIFKTQQVDTLNLDFWLAKAKFEKEQTYFYVSYTDLPRKELKEKNTMVELCAGGTVDISCLEKIDFFFKGFKFENFRVANFSQDVKELIAQADSEVKKKGEETDEAGNNSGNATKIKKTKQIKEFSDEGGNVFFNPGRWSFASEQKEFWGLPLTLDEISMDVDGTEKVGLFLKGGINVMGNEKCGIGAKAGLTIWGNVDWKNLALSYAETKFNTIEVNGSFNGTIDLDGKLSVKDEEDISGFDGEFNLDIKGLFEMKVEGAYFKVKKDEDQLAKDSEKEKKDKYFRAAALVGEAKTNAIPPIGMVKLTSIRGGLYINYGMKESYNMTKKGELKTALFDPEIRYKSYGGAFGIGLSIGDDTFVKGDFNLLTMIDMSGDKAKVSDIHLQGNVHALCTKDSDDGLVNAQADILYQDNTTDDKKAVDEYQRFLINITAEAGIGWEKAYKQFTGHDFKVPKAIADLQEFSQEAADDQGDGSDNSPSTTVDENGNRKKSKEEKKAEEELGMVGAKLSLELEVRHYPKKGNGITKWHLYLGKPNESDRLRITFIDFAIGKDQPVGIWAKLYANAYLCLGNELPNNGALPPVPDKIQEALGMEGADGEKHPEQKTKLEIARDNTFKEGPAGNIDGGIMFGAALGGEFGCNAIFCYANVEAMLGFDLILKKFKKDCLCTDGKPMGGKNGFYAMGQIYAMLSGELGLMINIWIFEGKIPLADMSVGALLKGGFPNPSWAYGRLHAKGEILGGLIKFKSTIEAKVGRVCIPEYGNPLDDVKIFGDVIPGADDLAGGWDKKNEASCYVDPTFTTNMKIGTRIPLLDEGKRARKAGLEGDENDYTTSALRTYIFHLDPDFMIQTFNAKAEDDTHPLTTDYVEYRSIDQENYTIKIGALQPETRYKITLRGYCKELIGGAEVDPIFKDKESNYKEVHRAWSQERPAYFVTGKLSDTIMTEVKGFVPMDGINPGGTLEEVTRPYAMLAHDRAEDYFNNPNYEFYGTVQAYPRSMSAQEIANTEGQYPDIKYGNDGRRLSGQKSAFENIEIGQFTEKGKNELYEEYAYYNMGVKRPLPAQYFSTDKVYRFRIYRVHLDKMENYYKNIQESYENIMKLSEKERESFEQELNEMKDTEEGLIRKDLYDYYKDVEKQYGNDEAKQRIREYADQKKTQSSAFSEVIFDQCYGYNGVSNFYDQFTSEKHLFSVNSQLPVFNLGSALCKQENMTDAPYQKLNYWQSKATVYVGVDSYKLCEQSVETPQGMTYEAKCPELRATIVNDKKLTDKEFIESYSPRYAANNPANKWYDPNIGTKEWVPHTSIQWKDNEGRTNGRLMRDHYISEIDGVRNCDLVMADAIDKLIKKQWNEYTNGADYWRFKTDLRSKSWERFKKFRAAMNAAMKANTFLETHGELRGSHYGTIRLHETQIGLMIAASNWENANALELKRYNKSKYAPDAVTNSEADKIITGEEVLMPHLADLPYHSYYMTVRRHTGYNTTNHNPGFGLLPSTAKSYSLTINYQKSDNNQKEVVNYGTITPEVITPDNNFRVYLLQNFDLNHNAVIDYEEAEAIKMIEYSNAERPFSDLQGIETMKNLETLKISNNGYSLKKVNLSSNYKLKEIVLGNTGISELDVSNLTELKKLSVFNSNLKKMDLTNNDKLEQVDLHYNDLESLKVDGLRRLRHLSCYGNKLDSLQLEDCNKLDVVNAGLQYENKFCHLFFKRISQQLRNHLNNTHAQQMLKNTDNNLQRMWPRSENHSVEWYNANVVYHFAQPDFWDLDKNLQKHLKETYGMKIITALRNKVTGEYVHTGGAKNQSIADISQKSQEEKDQILKNNSDLEMTPRKVYDEQLMFSNLKKATSLQARSLGIQSIENLDLWMPNLVKIDLSGNKIEHIDISFFKQLQKLNVSYNRLEDVSFENSSTVKEFDCTGNQFTYIDLKNMKYLKALKCGDNPIDHIWMNGNTGLELLHCPKIGLKELDLSEMYQLKDLDISDNNLKAAAKFSKASGSQLILPDNKTALQRIIMSNFSSYNQAVDLSDFVNLKYLDISHDKYLTSLTLPTNLEQLHASKCEYLSKIQPSDVSIFKKLTTFKTDYSTAIVTLPVNSTLIEEIDVTDVFKDEKSKEFDFEISDPNLKVLKVGVPSRKKGDKIKVNFTSSNLVTMWQNTWKSYEENKFTVKAYFNGQPIDKESEQLETITEEDLQMQKDMGFYYKVLKKKYNPHGRVLHAEDVKDITELDCSNQEIVHLTGIIKWMPNLVKLNASNNKIKEVALHFLKKLQYVDLSYNEELTTIHFRPSYFAEEYHIADQKSVCHQLKDLNVSYTNIFKASESMEMAVILVADRITATGATGKSDITIGNNLLTKSLNFNQTEVNLHLVGNKNEPTTDYVSSSERKKDKHQEKTTEDIANLNNLQQKEQGIINSNTHSSVHKGIIESNKTQIKDKVVLQGSKPISKGSLPTVDKKFSTGGSQSATNRTTVPASIQTSAKNQQIGNRANAAAGRTVNTQVKGSALGQKKATPSVNRGVNSNVSRSRSVQTPRRGLSLPAPDSEPTFAPTYLDIEVVDTFVRDNIRQIDKVSSQTPIQMTRQEDLKEKGSEQNALANQIRGAQNLQIVDAGAIDFNVDARGNLDSLSCIGISGRIIVESAGWIHAIRSFCLSGSPKVGRINLYFHTADLAIRWFFEWCYLTPEALLTVNVNVLTQLGSNSEYRQYNQATLIEAAEKGYVAKGEHYEDFRKEIDKWMKDMEAGDIDFIPGSSSNNDRRNPFM